MSISPLYLSIFRFCVRMWDCVCVSNRCHSKVSTKRTIDKRSISNAGYIVHFNKTERVNASEVINQKFPFCPLIRIMLYIHTDSVRLVQVKLWSFDVFFSLSLSKSSLKFFRKWARDWCSHWHRCTRERVQITSTTELIITTFAVDMQLSYDLIACIKRIFKYSTMIWFRKQNGKTLACMASILITASRWLLRCTVIFWWGNLNQYTNGESQTPEQKKNTKWKKKIVIEKRK